MINHARNLLVNIDSSQQPLDDCPGEELIDPSYRALTLPTYIQQIRSILFGSSPDRAMLNYRAAQLLGLIGATELVDYITALDPRITYPSSDLVTGNAWQLWSTPLGNTQGGLSWNGTPAAPDLAGQTYFDYTVTALGGNQFQVLQHSPGFQNNFYTTVLDFIPLIGSGYSIMVPNATSGTLQWKVWCYNRPQWDMGQLVEALKVVGEPTGLQLFGVQPSGDYALFQSLWTSHPLIPYKLGGLVLAMIYREEEIRNGQSAS